MHKDYKYYNDWKRLIQGKQSIRCLSYFQNLGEVCTDYSWSLHFIQLDEDFVFPIALGSLTQTKDFSSIEIIIRNRTFAGQAHQNK